MYSRRNSLTITTKTPFPTFSSIKKAIVSPSSIYHTTPAPTPKASEPTAPHAHLHFQEVEVMYTLPKEHAEDEPKEIMIRFFKYVPEPEPEPAPEEDQDAEMYWG